MQPYYYVNYTVFLRLSMSFIVLVQITGEVTKSGNKKSLQE